MSKYPKINICCLLAITFFPNYKTNATIFTKNKAILAGSLIAAGAAITYGYSLVKLFNIFYKFRDEGKYKNSIFNNFNPYEDRLICKWEEERWSTAKIMHDFALHHTKEFQQKIKNAANGYYICRHINSPYYLLWFHYDICRELYMISELRRSMIIISKIAFGLRFKAKEWLGKLEEYGKPVKNFTSFSNSNRRI